MAPGPETELPLDGITVVELSQIVAGPFAGTILGDLGADVIKIERPGVGDVMRSAGDVGAAEFAALNRNKRSIELDLKSEAGIESFHEVISGADVFLENLAPGATDRLGIGYEDLRDRHPELIYLSIKGYRDGPYGDRAGMDVVAEAMSGLMSVTGEEGRPPMRAGTSIADMGAALYGTMGVFLALWERERTGRGQKVDGTLFEACTHWMCYWITYADRTGENPAPLGGGFPAWALYDVFRTRDGEWLFVGVTTERHWPAFCRATGLEELLADERFETVEKRRENSGELSSVVADALSEREREPVLDALEAESVPAAPVNQPSDLLEDPHLADIGMLVDFRMRSESGDSTVKTVLTPVSGDQITTAQRRDPPELGEHTDEVLRDAGLSETAIADLQERGAFGD